jgi:heme-degrading monooxygenase HmoA
MFLAMNRFKIAKGFEAGFEKVWRERDSYLKEVEGFVSFNLLRCTEVEDFVLYASQSVWESERAFRAWTQSEHFRRAHAQASAPKGTYLAHPDLELFEAVL